MTLTVYVDCYTTPDRKGRGEGITAYRIDGLSGEWTSLGLAARTANPSFLTPHPRMPMLYCVHGGNMSGVSGFAIHGEGHLKPLGTWPSGGVNPVHLDVHASGCWLVVANYTGATAAVLPVQASGELGEPSDIVPWSGTTRPDPVEQSSSHPHAIPFDPSGDFVGALGVCVQPRT
jgi:6-phosphogluconolactonase (cycloisomerase 2 family)